MSAKSAPPVQHIHETIPILASDLTAAPATPAPAPVAVAEPAPKLRHYRVTLTKDWPVVTVSAYDKEGAWEAYRSISKITKCIHTPLIEPTTDPVSNLADLAAATSSGNPDVIQAWLPQGEPPQPPQRLGQSNAAYAAMLRDMNVPGTDQGYGRKVK